MAQLSFSNQQILTMFTAAAPYLPSTATVFETILPEQNIGFAELADVCDAIGHDFHVATSRGVPPAVFHPHLKSMVFALHASAVLADGRSDAWQMFSTGLSRMMTNVSPAAFYALALQLRANAD